MDSLQPNELIVVILFCFVVLLFCGDILPRKMFVHQNRIYGILRLRQRVIICNLFYIEFNLQIHNSPYRHPALRDPPMFFFLTRF